MSLLFGAVSATLCGDLRDDFTVHSVVPTSPR
jgi:hypothetical protein